MENFIFCVVKSADHTSLTQIHLGYKITHI